MSKVFSEAYDGKIFDNSIRKIDYTRVQPISENYGTILTQPEGLLWNFNTSTLKKDAFINLNKSYLEVTFTCAVPAGTTLVSGDFYSSTAFPAQMINDCSLTINNSFNIERNYAIHSLIPWKYRHFCTKSAFETTLQDQLVDKDEADALDTSSSIGAQALLRAARYVSTTYLVRKIPLYMLFGCAEANIYLPLDSVQIEISRGYNKNFGINGALFHIKKLNLIMCTATPSIEKMAEISNNITKPIIIAFPKYKLVEKTQSANEYIAQISGIQNINMVSYWFTLLKTAQINAGQVLPSAITRFQIEFEGETFPKQTQTYAFATNDYMMLYAQFIEACKFNKIKDDMLVSYDQFIGTKMYLDCVLNPNNTLSYNVNNSICNVNIAGTFTGTLLHELVVASSIVELDQSHGIYAFKSGTV